MSPHRSARALGPDDLVLSHFSLERHHPFEDRVAAAATAGFSGIGFFVGDYLRLKAEGHRPRELRAMVDDHGLCVAELEVARGWSDPDPARRDMLEPALWEMAEVFEPRYLQAIGPSVGMTSEAAAGFGRLCDDAADHGLLVGIEFLPFTNIATAADALDIVEAADRPNGGVCLDLWHHVRGADDPLLIERVPVERIHAVQMNDGPRRPVGDVDYKDDCLRNRLAPGEGEMDAVGFVRRLNERGVAVPWSLEVCDDSVWDGPATSHAIRCADAMRSVLASARS
jgi:sugar phosphate isomerase/epimerase